jgi:hypothetical protein
VALRILPDHRMHPPPHSSHSSPQPSVEGVLALKLSSELLENLLAAAKAPSAPRLSISFGPDESHVRPLAQWINHCVAF